MNRRKFINNIALGGSLMYMNAASATTILAPHKNQKNIKIALIGKGGMGTADTNTALRVPGVELVAVCDIYKPRLEEAKQQWGNHLQTESDYKKILQRQDIDAVIIGTPDHWHQPIAIAALESKKHVYCEKPIIHNRSEAKALLKAYKQSNKVFQMGTQGVSSIGTQIAKGVVDMGIIGNINFIDARFSAPPSPLSSFHAPAEATPENIWWDQFLGKAPKHEFDPQRFFNWRNWGDYGTGLAGDLFVHVIASVHCITGAEKPKRVYSDGDIVYYNDASRDTPDIILSLVDYEDNSKKQCFKMSLGANVVDGTSNDWGSTNFKMIGDQGSMQVNWDKVVIKTMQPIVWDKFSAGLQQITGFDRIEEIKENEVALLAKASLPDAHFLHFETFFNAIRNGGPVIADVDFGINASSVALRCFESQQLKKVI